MRYASSTVFDEGATNGVSVTNQEVLDLFTPVPGWLTPDEGILLYELARDCPGDGRVVELGSAQGRSTTCLALGTRDRGVPSLPVLAVDTHRGSPEHQKGQYFFDPVTFDETNERVDTFPAFRRHLRERDLTLWVEPWRLTTLEAARKFRGTIRLLFVDADHGDESVRDDLAAWLPHLAPDGVVVLHDVGNFPGPTNAVQELTRSRRFRLLRSVDAAVALVGSAFRGRLATERVPVNVSAWSSAHGQLGLDGDLGYEGKRVAFAGAGDEAVISAHGPSEVVLQAPAGASIVVAGTFNDDAQGQRVVASFRVDDSRGRGLADLGYAAPGTRTRSVSVVVPEDGELVLRCNPTTIYMCHSLWLLENASVEPRDPARELEALTRTMIERARDLEPGPPNAHELYVQTFGWRKPMGVRCVLSHLLSACERPRRVLLVTFDEDAEDLSSTLPTWCEVWSGKTKIEKELVRAGLTKAAIAGTLAENMFAKYVIPRLLMGERVLVCDDDVLWRGPCEEMLRSDADFVFLEDPPGYYSPRSVELFKSKGLVPADADRSPCVCAGLYVLNRKPVREASFVSEIIENSNHFRDEQSAVAMETRMQGVRYHVVDRPKYAHGGHAPRALPRDLEVLHMQNWLEPWRYHPGLQSSLLQSVVRTHGRPNESVVRAPGDETFAVYIPVHPAQAALLEMNLERAAEVGALKKAEVLLVVEDEPDAEQRNPRIKDICDRYEVLHRHAESRIGYYTPGESRMAIRCLNELASLAPNAAWLFRVDADILLVGDAWSHIASRGAASNADICANIRSDQRFDPDGFIVMPCSAFSRATCRDLLELLDGPDWAFIEPRLEGVADVDATFLARLLDKRIVAPEGRDGYLSVRDLTDPGDEGFWRAALSEGALAFHIAGPHDKQGRMKRALDRLRRAGDSR